MIFDVINTFSVLVYGVLIMFSFADIPKTRKNLLFITGLIAFLAIAEAAVYISFGADMLLWLYPVITHLPVVIFFVYIFKKPWQTALAALLLAYMLTEPRNWVGELGLVLFPDRLNIKNLTKSIATIPLLWVILRFISPKIRYYFSMPSVSLRFILWPAGIYYVYIYITTVYSDWLYRQNSITVTAMLSTFVVIFLFFSVMFYEQVFRNAELEKERNIINLQAKSINYRLEEIADSNEKMKQLRHDMRHYLGLIRGYAKIGNVSEIENIINGIEEGIEAARVTQYCINDSVNLILSHYSGKAEEDDIKMHIDAELPSELPISSVDLCAILANGIENAFNAVRKLGEDDERFIVIVCRMKSGKLIIRISNPYKGDIMFDGAYPKTNKTGHGYGVSSIVSTVNKNGGICDFVADKGIFTLRIVI